MSDTEHVVVRAGTCLFDQPSGEVIGVETSDDERYALRTLEHVGWWSVFLDTPWGAQQAWVHEGESCAKPSGR